jgi:hypothetical protein
MRNTLGGLVAAVWLLASILLWAGVVQVVPPPSASHAIGLTLSQSVLLAYHLSGVLEALTGAYLSLAIAGLLGSLWLLIEGLLRRLRLAAALGGAGAVIEVALGLFALLRIRLSLPMRPNASGLLTGASIAGQMATLMIPAALLLVLVLGAIIIVGRRAPARGAQREHPERVPRAAAGVPLAETGTTPPAGAAQEQDGSPNGAHTHAEDQDTPADSKQDGRPS